LLQGSHTRHLDFVSLKWHDLVRQIRGTAGTEFVPVCGLLNPSSIALPNRYVVAGMISLQTVSQFLVFASSICVAKV